ncbi:hypothetical protein FB451DRAFT_1173643 [Mycena latifolia]|nr:hypothetical protein FB451DRAFT_1173643 [Mycena latifolia]
MSRKRPRISEAAESLKLNRNLLLPFSACSLSFGLSIGEILKFESGLTSTKLVLLSVNLRGAVAAGGRRGDPVEQAVVVLEQGHWLGLGGGGVGGKDGEQGQHRVPGSLISLHQPQLKLRQLTFFDVDLLPRPLNQPNVVLPIMTDNLQGPDPALRKTSSGARQRQTPLSTPVSCTPQSLLGFSPGFKWAL